MIGLTIKFLRGILKDGVPIRGALLIPKLVNAPWYKYTLSWKVIITWQTGTDLFREWQYDQWVSLKNAKTDWVVLAFP